MSTTLNSIGWFEVFNAPCKGESDYMCLYEGDDFNNYFDGGWYINTYTALSLTMEGKQVVMVHKVLENGDIQEYFIENAVLKYDPQDYC